MTNGRRVITAVRRVTADDAQKGQRATEDDPIFEKRNETIRGAAGGVQTLVADGHGRKRLVENDQAHQDDAQGKVGGDGAKYDAPNPVGARRVTVAVNDAADPDR